MGNRITHLLDSISAQLGSQASDACIVRIGLNEHKLTAAQEGKQIKSILDDIIEKHGEGMARKTMRPCGYHCISDTIIQIAKDKYKDSASLQAFLDALNQEHIGGGHLRTTDGIILGEYDRCYCGTAKNTKGMSPVYCECSAGWFEKLFSSVFERPVEVVIKRSIVQGDESCLFEITHS